MEFTVPDAGKERVELVKEVGCNTCSTPFSFLEFPLVRVLQYATEWHALAVKMERHLDREGKLLPIEDS